MAAAVVAIGSVIGSVASAVASVVAPIAATISAAIAPVVATISSVVGSVTAALTTTVGKVVTTITTTVGPLVAKLKVGVADLTAAIDTATKPILEPLAGGLEILHDKLKAVDTWVAEKLLIVEDVTKLIDYVATVKILTDLVKGTASISDVIGKVAEGKGFETAVAIVRLTKSIAALGVNIVDRIDTQWKILEAEVTSFEDRFKRNFEMAIEQEKARLLSIVTPKMVTLGEHQLALAQSIARVSRHIEDEAWFASMLLRLLR